MLKKSVLIFVFIFVFSFGANAISVSSGSAILVEANTGKVLFEQDADRRRLMASTTKIMTALVVLENAKMTDIVTVSGKAAGTEGSSMYLVAGEKISVEDLLYGLMLSSGNDAANALAEYVGGSIEGFVKMMNDKAGELGLSNTSFETPSGLDGPQHYSTARDMANLTLYALKNADFAKIVATKRKTVGNRYLANHNRLLFSYKYAVGVKTGYTIASGRCLVSAAMKDGVLLVAVTLNNHNYWKEHINLHEYGFSRVKYYKFIDNELPFCSLPVVGGKNIEIIAKDELSKTLIDFDGEVNIKQVIELPRFCYPPIKKGQIIGKAHYYINGEHVACTDLLSDTDIKIEKKKERNGIMDFFGNLFVAIFGLNE